MAATTGRMLTSAWGRNHIGILRLDRHSLTNNPLHSGKTNSKLVLQQLAHRTDTAIAQMVDIVGIAHIVAQVVDIIDGRKNIVFDDMLGNQAVYIGFDRFPQRFLVLVLFQNLLEHNKTDLFVDPILGTVKNPQNP